MLWFLSIHGLMTARPLESWAIGQGEKSGALREQHKFEGAHSGGCCFKMFEMWIVGKGRELFHLQFSDSRFWKGKYILPAKQCIAQITRGWYGVSILRSGNVMERWYVCISIRRWMYLVALFVNGFTGNASDLQCQNKQQATFNIVSRTYVRGVSFVIKLTIPRVYYFECWNATKILLLRGT